MRAMALGGLVVEDLADDARSGRALGKSEMALLVKSVGQYGKHAAGKNAGFRKDDIIVELDGNADRITESELVGKLLHAHSVGDRVKAVVLRGEQRVNLTLPIQ
jgi:S1-C subfamily serine protease